MLDAYAGHRVMVRGIMSGGENVSRPGGRTTATAGTGTTAAEAAATVGIATGGTTTGTGARQAPSRQGACSLCADQPVHPACPCTKAVPQISSCVFELGSEHSRLSAEKT